MLIVCNWKMNKSFSEIDSFFSELKGNKIDNKLIICPPYPYLKYTKDKASEFSNIEVAAQSCFAHAEKGSYTGQVSLNMLIDQGCDYIVQGHAEDRRYNSFDLDRSIDLSIKAIKNKIGVIFCIGEKEFGQTQKVSEELSYIIGRINSDIDKEEISEKFVFAYEPIWAIGGKSATNDYIESVFNELSKIVKSQGIEANIIYGGAVNTEVYKGILGVENLGGLMIGNASLSAANVIEFVKK